MPPLKNILSLLTAVLLVYSSAWAQKADSTAKGKWSGSAAVSGGYNQSQSPFKGVIPELKHEAADVKLNLKYAKDNFTATANFSSGWDNHWKASTGLSMKNEDDFSMNWAEIKYMGSRYNFTTNLKWTKPDIIYNVFAQVGYNYTHNKKNSYIMNFEAEDVKLVGEDNNSYSFSSSGGFNLTKKYTHGRKLFAEASFGYSNVDRYIEWASLSLNEGAANYIYRKTPFSIGLRANAATYLSQDHTFGIKNLNTEAGGLFSVSYDNDKYRGAYLSDISDKNSWVDSLKLRETFRYGVITMTPYVKADYSYKFLKLKLDYRLQFYADKLTNKIEHQSYDFKNPALTGSSEAEFRIADNHFIAVGFQTMVRRPSYTQLCWYAREGNYPGQFIVGNPNLKVSRSYRNILSYRIKFRKFSSELSSSFTRNLRQVEQTFFEDYIGDRKFKFFTWVNTSYSKVWNTAFFLRYDTKRFYLRTDLGYYDYVEKAKSAGSVKKNHYWTAKASGGVMLKGGWTISSDISYQSKITRSYHSFDKYYSLNSRVEKKFKKHTIYLEGRDLLEQKITTSWISEDETSGWSETAYNNRRFFRIGYIFNF